MTTSDRLEFFKEKYDEFLEERTKIEYPIEPIKYRTIEFPTQYDLTQHSMQLYFFSTYAEEALRELANSINQLASLTRNLEAWGRILEDLSAEEKLRLLNEFVETQASTAINLPYTIKARFLFAVAHISHQANSARMGDEWIADFKVLPQDHEIHHEHAYKMARDWKSWKKLNRALSKADSSDFKSATKSYRSKYTHRLTPRIEVGYFEFVNRRPRTKSESHPDPLSHSPAYGMGGSEPLAISEVTDELKKQCSCFSQSFSLFERLVSEQKSAIYTE
jgi:hypothetical protein